LFGIGIGILIAVVFTFAGKLNYELSDGQIEIKARQLGMEYPKDIKINIKDGDKK